MLKKDLVKRLMEIKGEVRGVVLKTDADFVLKEKGKEGLKQVEKELERLGQPIKYKEIKTMDFYPIGLRALSLLAIKEVFGFDNEKIKEIGRRAPKLSLFTKLFMKYFFSTEKTAEQVPKMWEKHYTIGKLEVETNEKERFVVLKLRDFFVHPILCCYLDDYFSTILEMVVGAPVSSRETKCNFRGDKYHQFLLEW